MGLNFRCTFSDPYQLNSNQITEKYDAFIKNGPEIWLHFLRPFEIKKNSITDKVFFFFIQNGSDLLTHFLRPISIKTQTQLLKKDGVFLMQNGCEFPKYFL